MNKTALDKLLNSINWQEVERNTTPKGLYATHWGILAIGEIELRVYQLNNGQRIIDADDMMHYFGVGLEKQ